MKQNLLIKSYKELALRKYDYKKVSDLFSNEIEEAILIRLVENTFLDLFSQGSSTSHN
jgi:hypothetical protein|tara:strand:+ start:490 stop:663 length:174 start_codon:yes stop_codon:yes gene_type:complete